MLINDRIYGSIEVKEPVLIDLIDSKAVQRLKKIGQFGVPQEYYPFKDYSRYEHCIGVMLLLKRLDASLEEQVAGLLHDASHTAFSHTVDWVLGDREKEDYQDKNHFDILNRSDVPESLSRHGFSLPRIANTKNYGLLERKAPDLCADRVDYSLREFASWANPSIVDKCLESMIVYDGRMVFNSRECAKEFGLGYSKCQTEHWGSPDTTMRWELLSRALRMALDNKIISEYDFQKDDEYMMKRLRDSNNQDINSILAILSLKKLPLEFVTNNPQFSLKKKFRFVDPSYLENGNLYRLSESDSGYKKLLEETRKDNESGVKVNLLAYWNVNT